MSLLLGGAGSGAPHHPLQLRPQEGLALALRGQGHVHALRLQLQIALVVGVVAVEFPLVQLHNAAGDAVQKVPVVGDHQQGAPEFLQIVLQPVGHLAVQVVGGLVQHQKLRRGQEDAHQGDPLSLSPGECLHSGVKIIDSQFGQHGLGLALQIPHMGMPLIFPDDGLENGVPLREAGILGQIADVQVSPAHHGAGVRLLKPRHDLQQGGLARAVDADEAHLLPLLDGEIGVVK